MARHEFRKVVRGSDGLPVAGAEVRFYEPGTTTPRPVFAAVSGGTAAGQPIESDANGVALAYLPPGLIYKVVTTFDAVTDTIENYPAVDPVPAGNWLVPYRDGGGVLASRVMADGRGIFEADPVTDALAQFLPGGTFTVSPSVSRHRWLKVGDTSSGLTQNMTVAVNKATAGWVAGDSVIVVKGDTSVRTVTVSGLDEDGLGTTTLRRSRDFVELLVQSTDSDGIKFERGPQGRINPDAADVAYDGGTVADKLAELSVSVPQSGLSATAAPAIVLGNGATITAEDHGEYTPDGAELQIITVVARHATNTALAVALTLDEDIAMRVKVIVDEEQDGPVTISRAGTNTINGLTSIEAAGASAVIDITPLQTTGAYHASGGIKAVSTLAAALDCNGQQVYGNLAQIWTASVDGAAPTISGMYVIVDAALTIPTVEGWQMNGRFAGDYDLTFNGDTLDTGATANALVFVQVESATTITVVIDGTVYRETDFA